jgi:hypothetical protein
MQGSDIRCFERKPFVGLLHPYTNESLLSLVQTIQDYVTLISYVQGRTNRGAQGARAPAPPPPILWVCIHWWSCKGQHKWTIYELNQNSNRTIQIDICIEQGFAYYFMQYNNVIIQCNQIHLTLYNSIRNSFIDIATI